jgi:predicted dehydrogenase
VLPGLAELGQQACYVWGRDAERAEAAARRHGVPRGGADLAGLLADADAVYVATPVASHVPVALAAAQAGRHVLIEKPLAGNLPSGGARIAAVTAAARRCAGVAYYRRLGPAASQLQEAVAAGRPRRVRVDFRCAFEPSPGDPKRWRTDAGVSGGGVLADAGSHRLDLLLMLFGRPCEVAARRDRRFPGGAERRAVLRLRWPCGLEAQCRLEWSGEGPPRDSVTLQGDRAEVSLDPLDAGLAPNPHVPLIADFVAAAQAAERAAPPPACPVAEAMLVDDLIAAAERSSALRGLPVSPWRERPRT